MIERRKTLVYLKIVKTVSIFIQKRGFKGSRHNVAKGGGHPIRKCYRRPMKKYEKCDTKMWGKLRLNE